MEYQLRVNGASPSQGLSEQIIIRPIKFSQFSFLAEISNEYDKEIKAKIDEVVNLVVAQQWVKNSEQGLVGSALSGLVLFLKTFLVPALTGVSNTIPYLQDILNGALEGLASGGLIGLVGGLAKNAAAGFREISAEIGENFFEGTFGPIDLS